MIHNRQRIAQILRHAIPYFAILVALFSVMLIYSLIIHARLKSEAEQRNQNNVEFYDSVIEDNITEFQKNCFLLAFNPVVAKMNYYDVQTIHSDSGVNDAFSTVNAIRSFEENNTLVDNLLIYYPSYDMMLYKGGPLYSYMYYNVSGSAFDIENQYENFISILENYKRPSSQFVFDQSGLFLQATYFQTIGQTSSEKAKPDRIIIAEISTSAMNDILKTQVNASASEILLYVNKEGTLIAANSDDITPFITNGKLSIDSLSDDYIVVSADSTLLDATLISIQPRSGVYHLVNSVSIILSIALVFAALSIGVLGLFFAKKNITAENVLLKKLHHTADGSSENAMQTIEKEIDLLIETNKAALDEIYQQRKLVHASFLRELLFRHPADEKKIDLLLTTYGLSLEGDHFILVSARRGKNIKGSTWTEAIDKVLNFGTEAITVYWTRMDKLDVFLCNYDDSDGAVNFTSFIRVTLSDLVVDQETITASEEFDSLNNIADAWTQIQASSYLGQDIISHEINESSFRDGKGKIAQIAHSVILNEFDNSQLGLYMIAERIGVSQTLLSKQFKEEYGTSVAQYINQVRIEAAKKLMISGSENLKVIALCVGFTSDINFIRVFKRHMNMTPGQFRNQYDTN